MKKKIKVEYLYLDLETCERCIGTENVLDEVMMVISPALNIAGFDVLYDKIEMKTAEIASNYQFLSSPTIRVNGQDICQSVAENSCGCCSDISGADVNCRVFEYHEEAYEVPPKEMLARAILSAALGQTRTGCCCSEYELPANLKAFYEGKKHDACDGANKVTSENKKGEGAYIKVLGSGCKKCNQLQAAAQAALKQVGMDTAIEHVTDFSEIAAYGVMTTPALVIDGKVVSYGKVLKSDEIVKILRKVR